MSEEINSPIVENVTIDKPMEIQSENVVAPTDGEQVKVEPIAIDNLTNQSISNQSYEPAGQRGGFREGAGRKEGSKNKTTLATREALRAFQERVRSNVDKLFNAQLAIAVGNHFLFRVDISEDDKGKLKKTNVLVTDPEEIKKALDQNLIDGNDYYFISTKSPDNKALESLLDRAFGRATQPVELEAPQLQNGVEQLQRISEDLRKLVPKSDGTTPDSPTDS